MKIYGEALAKRLYSHEENKIRLLHDIIRLCREKGGNLIYKDGLYRLHYKNMYRIGRTYEELCYFKETFRGEFK